MIEISCTSADHGKAALEVLRQRLPAAPAGYLRLLLRQGKVRRGEQPLAAGAPVAAGDRLQLPDSRRLHQLQAFGEVEILLENRELLIVEKPCGLAIHSGVGHETDNLTARVEALLRRRGERFRVAAVHRLDVGTSGPVVFAKGRQAAAALGRLFMEGKVEKEYLALVSGRLPAAGRLTSPVPAKGGWKESATSWECLRSGSGLSLLRLRLHSGRTHQIRRQLADAGHPIAGDRRYGGPDLPGLDRLFLHASRLSLPNPADGVRLEIVSSLPAPLAAALPASFSGRLS